MAMTTRDPRLADYRALLAKIDSKFDEIRGRHPGRFQCASGCHACCAPGLTVSGVERAWLAAHVRENPGLRERLAALQRAAPHHGRRCAFLAADGRCALYEARPAVCRSHGAPIRFATDAGTGRDVCPKNFGDVDLARLDATDSIDVDTLNTLLFVINRRFDPDDTGQRHPLTLAGILGEVEAEPRPESR